jgi:hypothetical protein
MDFPDNREEVEVKRLQMRGIEPPVRSVPFHDFGIARFDEGLFKPFEFEVGLGPEFVFEAAGIGIGVIRHALAGTELFPQPGNNLGDRNLAALISLKDLITGRATPDAFNPAVRLYALHDAAALRRFFCADPTVSIAASRHGIFLLIKLYNNRFRPKLRQVSTRRELGGNCLNEPRVRRVRSSAR